MNSANHAEERAAREQTVTAIARLRQQRRFDFATDVDGLPVVFHLERPSEVDALRIRRGEFPVLTRPDYWCNHVRGWTGITDECIFGVGIGNDSPVAFDPDLLLAWLVDRRSDLLGAIADKLSTAVTAHLEQRFAIQGNSQPS